MTVLDRVRPRTRRTSFPITREAAYAVQDRVARLTAGRRDGPLRVDWKVLDDSEIRDLADLADDAPTLTGRRLKRFEAILERASGLAPGTFEAEREQAKTEGKLRELAARARRLPISRKQEEGLLAEVWRQIAEHRALRLDHLGVLLFVLATFEAGEALAPGSRVDRDPDGDPTLTFDHRMGLFGHAGGDVGSRGMKLLEHLERNSWVTLSRGPTVTVKLGARAKRVLEATR